MIKSAKAIYKNGRLHFLTKTDIPRDGVEVMVNYEVDGKKGLKSLYGIWKGKVSDDIEDIIKSIRSEWIKRMQGA